MFFFFAAIIFPVQQLYMGLSTGVYFLVLLRAPKGLGIFLYW